MVEESVKHKSCLFPVAHLLESGMGLGFILVNTSAASELAVARFHKLRRVIYVVLWLLSLLVGFWASLASRMWPSFAAT